HVDEQLVRGALTRDRLLSRVAVVAGGQDRSPCRDANQQQQHDRERRHQAKQQATQGTAVRAWLPPHEAPALRLCVLLRCCATPAIMRLLPRAVTRSPLHPSAPTPRYRSAP